MDKHVFRDVDLDSLREKARERTVKAQSIEYDLNTILNRIKKGSIKIDPDYQRRHRWNDETSSRLIESLLLNIPVPTIYLSQDVDIDEDTDGLPFFSVIDGQQRLTAIRDFMDNTLELKGLEILDDLNGYYFSDLPSFLVRRLEDRTINCLRIDSTVDSEVKFDIFERLNSGSVELTPQELRNATYRGKFNEMIVELASDELFREITNMSSKRVEKMEDVELVLRFFSLTGGRYKNYKPIMKTFLNNSMAEFSQFGNEKREEMKEEFKNQIELISVHFGKMPFAKWKQNENKLASRFNSAVFDAVVGAVDTIVSEGGRLPNNAESILRDMFNNEAFFNAISSSINDASKLRARIDLLYEALRKND